jgi:hypothetical protein
VVWVWVRGVPAHQLSVDPWHSSARNRILPGTPKLTATAEGAPSPSVASLRPLAFMSSGGGRSEDAVLSVGDGYCSIE